MPTTRGFEIQIEDSSDGKPLATYGTRSKGNIIYAKICAKDKLQFQIRIKPTQPFPEAPDAGEEVEGRVRYNLRHQKNAEDVMDCIESNPKRERPYSYFGYVFLNGSSDSEDARLLRTDPDDEKYKSRGYLFTGRCTEVDDQTGSDSDGYVTKLQISPWVFSEKGIDVLLGHMNIAKPDSEVPATEHDEDMADLTSALAQDSMSRPVTNKQGAIEVVIKRKVCGKLLRGDHGWKREDGSDMQGDDSNTHHVTLGEKHDHTFSAKTYSTTHWRKDESFYAKVVFEYFDIAKLVNMGLCHRDGSPNEHRLLRALPAPPTSHESLTSSLKRVRGSEESEPATGQLMLTDDEVSSASASSTSDSDVPRTKRRGAINRRKPKAISRKRSGNEASMQTSEEASALTAPTSDSDVPTGNRRKAVINRRRKAIPRKPNKTISWTGHKAAEATNEKPPLPQIEFNPPLPDFEFDMKDQVSQWALEFQGQDETLDNENTQLQLPPSEVDPALILQLSDEEEQIE